MSRARKKRGPRPEGATAREDIVEAARSTFSALGYDRATIRRIAAAAAVDPALVIHYFGSKEDLFAAAVKLPIRPEQAFEHVFRGPPAEIGLRLASLFFGIWENPESREALIGQLRMAFTTDTPPPFRDFLAEVVVRRAEHEIGGPDPKLRVELAASHLLGVALLRYVVKLEPLAATPIEKLIEAIAPRITSYLTADQQT
ncbi:MAG: TetR family transcriptional regulator [Acidimicrobiia bacterium]